MLKMKRNVVILTVGFVVFAVCIFGFLHSKKFGYWKAIGITNNGLYTLLKESKGNPDSIEICEDGGVYVIYDGIRFYYPNEDLTGSFQRAEIQTDKYVFGKQGITIGTSKDIIISSYKHTKEISGLPDGELAYECNGSTSVWFEFDESNLIQLTK